MIRNSDPRSMKNIIAVLGGSLVLSCLASQAFASAYYISGGSVSNLGTANSGTAAIADDASTNYYNPAGLTRIPSAQLVLATNIVQTDIKLSASAAMSPTGVSLLPATDNAGTVNSGPSFYLAQRLDDRWVFGFSLTTPFGLNNKYSEDGVARYIAVFSEIITMDFGPSIAYQLAPGLSIGAGPDALYTRVNVSGRIRSRLDVFPAEVDVPADGFQRTHLDGWGWGWHAGILWEPTENTRVGANYHSHFNVGLKGDAQVLGAITLPGPALVTGSAAGLQDYFISRPRVHITLPEVATVSLYHRFGFFSNLAVVADIEWINWSRIQTSRASYDRPLPTAISFEGLGAGATVALNQFALLTPDTDRFENFRDSRRFSLGFVYTLSDTWLFRIGGTYDETPVRNEYRTVRLPDADSYKVAVGAGYLYNKAWRFDFGYMHVFMLDSSMNDHALYGAQSTTPLTLAVITGDYKSSANVLGFQARYDFL